MTLMLSDTQTIPTTRIIERVYAAVEAANELYGPYLGQDWDTGPQFPVFSPYSPQAMDVFPQVIYLQIAGGTPLNNVMLSNWNRGPDVPTQVNMGDSLGNLQTAMYWGERYMGLDPAAASRNANGGRAHEKDHTGPFLAAGVAVELGTYFRPTRDPGTNQIALGHVAYTMPADDIAEVGLITTMLSLCAPQPAFEGDLRMAGRLVSYIPRELLSPTDNGLLAAVLAVMGI